MNKGEGEEDFLLHKLSFSTFLSFDICIFDTIFFSVLLRENHNFSSFMDEKRETEKERYIYPLKESLKCVHDFFICADKEKKSDWRRISQNRRHKQN